MWLKVITYYIKKKKKEEGKWKRRHEKCIILIMLSEKVMKIFIRKNEMISHGVLSYESLHIYPVI